MTIRNPSGKKNAKPFRRELLTIQPPQDGLVSKGVLSMKYPTAVRFQTGRVKTQRLSRCIVLGTHLLENLSNFILFKKCQGVLFFICHCVLDDQVSINANINFYHSSTYLATCLLLFYVFPFCCRCCFFFNHGILNESESKCKLKPS